jgi:hypothetical protein
VRLYVVCEYIIEHFANMHPARLVGFGQGGMEIHAQK